MNDWTIIKWQGENEHGYISLFTGNMPLNPDLDIELENENGEPDIIYAGDYEIALTDLTEAEADEFIDMSIADQDELVGNLDY